MAKRADFEPYEVEGRWVVSVTPAMSASGKRVRKFFREKEEAKKFGASLREVYRKGHRGGLIPLELAREAAAAVKALEGTGLRLLDVAREAAERWRQAEKGISFLRFRWRRPAGLRRLSDHVFWPVIPVL